MNAIQSLPFDNLIVVTCDARCRGSWAILSPSDSEIAMLEELVDVLKMKIQRKDRELDQMREQQDDTRWHRGETRGAFFEPRDLLHEGRYEEASEAYPLYRPQIDYRC